MTSLICYLIFLLTIPHEQSLCTKIIRKTYLFGPVFKELLGIQFKSEAITISLQLLPLDVLFPTPAQYVLDPPHVGIQLPLNLTRPDDGTRHRRQVSHAAHVAGFALRVLHFELFVQRLDVILDSLNQLGLVLTDGAADVRPDKESVETREDAEHLIGVPRRAELIAQTCSDSRFNSVNSLVISENGQLLSSTLLAR